MNGTRLFVDTNILIYLLNGDTDISKILEGKTLIISFITELELKSYSNISDEEMVFIDELLDECQIININDEIKRLAIEFRKTKKMKLPDAIVAASAFYSKLPIFTADKDFMKIEELEVIIFEV